jgi:hypothetical protein
VQKKRTKSVNKNFLGEPGVKFQGSFELDDRDKKALSDIEEYGCHVLNVAEGEDEPSFTYSIGINKNQRGYGGASGLVFCLSAQHKT